MGTVQVNNLGKAYKQYPRRWSRLAEWLGLGQRHQLTWVLRGIDFHLESGEALGIIGVNGAGKSTLLKLIVGTTKPTEGQISLHGRVSALLELGMGFHPEFTGRQNVIMAGQLSGLRLEEIQALMPSIEAFAEIGNYIDQPLRVYSSGMQMRLAFSVATARRPDILIIDEALSVGDDYFQHKSFERIRQFRAEGTTLLIVSHAKQAIQSICDRAILIDAGSMIRQGSPDVVFDYYNALLAGRSDQPIEVRPLHGGRVQTESGTRDASIDEVLLLERASGAELTRVEVGTPLRLRIRVTVHKAIPRLVLGYLIKDQLGQAIFGTNTHYLECPLSDLQPGDSIDYNFDFTAALGPGSYSITAALHDSYHHVNHNYQWRDLALLFEVVNSNQSSFVGCNWLPPALTIERAGGCAGPDILPPGPRP